MLALVVTTLASVKVMVGVAAYAGSGVLILLASGFGSYWVPLLHLRRRFAWGGQHVRREEMAWLGVAYWLFLFGR